MAGKAKRLPRRRRVWNRVCWAVRRRRTTATTSPSTSPSSTPVTSSAFSPANTSSSPSSSRRIAAGAGEVLRRSVETSGKEGDTPSFGEDFAANLVSWCTGGVGNEAVQRRYSVGSRRSTKWWWCHFGTAPQLHLPNLAVEGDRRETAVRLPPCAGGRMRVPLVHGSVTDGHNAKDRLLTYLNHGWILLLFIR